MALRVVLERDRADAADYERDFELAAHELIAIPSAR